MAQKMKIMTNASLNITQLLNWFGSVDMEMSRDMEVIINHQDILKLKRYLILKIYFFSGLKMMFRYFRRHKIPLHSLGPVSKKTLEKYGLPLTLEGVPRHVYNL